MAFQTRSEITGIEYFNSFLEAFNNYKEDQTVWKISFDNKDSVHMRWRPKKKGNVWDNEDCILNLSVEYTNEQNLDRIYWVWQDLMPEEVYMEELLRRKQTGEILEEEYKRLWDRACIRGVLTEEEFVNSYRDL